METFPTCSICFDDLLAPKAKVEQRPSAPPAEEGDSNDPSKDEFSVCSTPCGHVFHQGCVGAWVDQHRHCPQCRQRVISSSRLVTLYFAQEKKPLGIRQQSGNDNDVILDVMQCQLDDLETECQRLRKALAHSEDQLQTTVSELSVLEAAAQEGGGGGMAAAINRELESVRGEQEDLQRTAVHMREEIQVLTDNVRDKEAEIRQKDAAYEYLLGRNAALIEQSESNSRLVSSLRAQMGLSSPLSSGLAPLSSGDSLYERVVEEDYSLQPPHPTSSAEHPTTEPRLRRHQPLGCCLNLFRCLKGALLVVLIFVILIGVLVVTPLLHIFSAQKQ